MRKLIFFAAILVASLAALSARGGSQALDASRAQFNELETHHLIGAETEIWTVRVYTRQGKFAGSGVFACVPVSVVASLQQCNGTYLLPHGRIAVQGLLTSRAAFNLVIVGGTDDYLGAKGSLTVIRTQQNPRKAGLTFFFK